MPILLDMLCHARSGLSSQDSSIANIFKNSNQISFVFFFIFATAFVDGLLWRDVKQFSPQNIFQNRFSKVARIPLQTLVEQNCTLDRYSQQEAGITGYGCQEIPFIEVLHNITTLYVHHTSVRVIRQGSLTKLVKAQKLELSQNKIILIEPDSFLYLDNVEFLGLNENPLSHLRPGAFRGLRNLKTLVLFHTRIQYWSSIVPAVMDLPQLQLLDLGFTLISNVGETDLAPLNSSTITHLSLCNCGLLSSIHPKAFSHLRQLVGLYLKDDVNLIRTQEAYQDLLQMIGNLTQPGFRVIDISQLIPTSQIRAEVLQKVAATGIEVLILAQSIREISNRTFPLMPNISSLVVPLARMNIEAEGLSKLPNLREIVFSRSFMPDIPRAMALPQLEYLDISSFERNPQLLEFHDRIFENMSRLRELNVRHRAISDLASDTFIGLVSLERLDMAYCHLSYLPVGVFDPLVNLGYLDLTANAIFMVTAVPKAIFASLSKLRYLSLALTAADNFPPDIFNHLGNLEVLKLNNNSLTFIPDLSANKNLKTLDVSANLLDQFIEYRLHNGSFHNRLPLSIKSIDLSNNKISHKVYVPSTIQWIDLSNNPFMCTCELKPVLRLLKHPKIEVNNLAFPSQYECVVPGSQRYTSITETAARLERGCQPQIFILIFIVFLTILMAVISMLGALVYRARFVKWLANYTPQTDEVYSKKRFEFDAFVSYSSYDVNFVINDLLPSLEDLSKLKLCVYDRDFLAGKSITDCVLDSMKKSRKIIIILSNHFLQSSWCKFETDLAQYVTLEENRDLVIIVKIGPLNETAISSKLSYLLKTRVYLDYCTLPRDKFFSKLVQAVKEERPKYRRFRRQMSVLLKPRTISKAAEETEATSSEYSSVKELDEEIHREKMMSPRLEHMGVQQASCSSSGYKGGNIQQKSMENLHESIPLNEMVKNY